MGFCTDIHEDILEWACVILSLFLQRYHKVKVFHLFNFTSGPPLWSKMKYLNIYGLAQHFVQTFQMMYPNNLITFLVQYNEVDIFG